MAELPRAILFDLDDTIITTRTRRDQAWADVAAEFAHELQPVAPTLLAQAIRAEAQAFFTNAENAVVWRQSLREARREVVRRAFTRLGKSRRERRTALSHRLADRFSDVQDEAWILSPGAHETIDELKAGGVRLALITNGDSTGQRAKVGRSELDRRFHHVQIEGEHGFGKPDPQAYRHALRALGAEPHEAWIVGDNLDWEVAAPQRLGIHAIWYDPHGEGLPADHPARPDRVIRTLAELLT
ncbi:MAG TPA: HAD family hydrolase [Caulobacteraceae bacterium]|nr:HAD family hydrolase [Caulobacteraceae bacterium]